MLRQRPARRGHAGYHSGALAGHAFRYAAITGCLAPPAPAPARLPALQSTQANSYKLDAQRLVGIVLVSPDCDVHNHKTDFVGDAVPVSTCMQHAACSALTPSFLLRGMRGVHQH